MLFEMHDEYKSPQPQRLFPEKLFYKIGEVSRLVGVETYVLRFWETEFPFLKPRKSKSGQRVYAKSDIDLIVHIKRLLYEEKYTIDGVRRKFGGAEDFKGMDLSDGNGIPVETVREEKKISPDAERILNMVKSRLRNLLQHHFGA
jgi:DNA-binding transcriptional MerR regulator